MECAIDKKTVDGIRNHMHENKFAEGGNQDGDKI